MHLLHPAASRDTSVDRRVPGYPGSSGPVGHCKQNAYRFPSKITTVSLTPAADPALPDDDDPAVHAGHVNVLADELARLFGLVPLAVREQAAQAALDVINRHLRQQQDNSDGH
jgi:hypothetical protein